MTICNLSLIIHHMASTHCVIMVALLPIQIKNRDIPQKQLDEQLQRNQEGLNEVLQQVLQPLTFWQNPSAESRYYIVPCADGNFRHCIPVVAAWLADCPEYCDLHHLERHVWSWCEGSKNELGDNVPPDERHPQQDHKLHRMLRNANTKPAETKLSSRHVHRGFHVFRHIPCIVRDLPKPDLPHTMQIPIQCRSVCLISSRSGFFTSWRRMNGSTSTMQYGYPCLLTTTSPQKLSYLRKFLNGMGRRWRKGARTCLDLQPRLYEDEAPLSVPYSMALLSSHGNC